MDSNNREFNKNGKSFYRRASEREIICHQPSHPEDKKIKKIALLVAIVIHVIVFSIKIPSFTQYVEPPEPSEPSYPIATPIFPIPIIPESELLAPQLEGKRRIPVPDPTPKEPEPIEEPGVKMNNDVTFSGDEVLSPYLEPVTPPIQPPRPAGVGSVTWLERIPESYVKPVYPEIPRRAMLGGSVSLQIVVKRDGSVADIVILHSSRTNLGFEEAAVEAVRQWRYKPATLRGKPVDVYLTVHVIFELNN